MRNDAPHSIFCFLLYVYSIAIIITVKGPGVMQGYINDPASTAAVMDSDGYFNTGDLVRINPATGMKRNTFHPLASFF